MRKNVGKKDRLIRMILAIALSGLIVGNLVTGIIASILLSLAAIFLVTGMIRFCPIYALFGKNTCEKE